MPSESKRSLLRRVSNPLFGPDATSAELALGWGAAFTAMAAQLIWALSSDEWSMLQSVVAVAFAFDIGGGVVVNTMRSARRWWHRGDQGTRQHLAFFLAHIHPFIIAAMWPGFDWWQAAALYVSMLAMTSLVLGVPVYLKRPVSFGLASIGIIIGVTVLAAPAGLVWLPPMYYVKLVMAHAVPNDRESTRT